MGAAAAGWEGGFEWTGAADGAWVAAAVLGLTFVNQGVLGWGFRAEQPGRANLAREADE